MKVVQRFAMAFAAGIAAFLVCSLRAAAGPPFITDDPEPVDFRNGEFYLASQHFFVAGSASGTLPHIEFNYGIAPDVMFHSIVPMAYFKPVGLPFEYGPGDIELGLKFRFVHETRSRPMIGTFPHVEIPAGSAGRGLGAGTVRVFLPLWLQKSWGAWTTYGGGGYWINPGPGNRNFWQFGWEVQRDLSKAVTVGAELIRNSPSQIGRGGETAVNLGALVTVRKGQIIMFSAGHDFRGPNHFFAYVAYYWTWGPRR